MLTCRPTTLQLPALRAPSPHGFPTASIQPETWRPALEEELERTRAAVMSLGVSGGGNDGAEQRAVDILTAHLRTLRVSFAASGAAPAPLALQPAQRDYFGRKPPPRLAGVVPREPSWWDKASGHVSADWRRQQKQINKAKKAQARSCLPNVTIEANHACYNPAARRRQGGATAATSEDAQSVQAGPTAPTENEGLYWAYSRRGCVSISSTFVLAV